MLICVTNLVLYCLSVYRSSFSGIQGRIEGAFLIFLLHIQAALKAPAVCASKSVFGRVTQASSEENNFVDRAVVTDRL